MEITNITKKLYWNNRIVSQTILFRPIIPSKMRKITEIARNVVPTRSSITMNEEFILKLSSSMATMKTSSMFHLSRSAENFMLLSENIPMQSSMYLRTGNRTVKTNMMAAIKKSPDS